MQTTDNRHGHAEDVDIKDNICDILHNVEDGIIDCRSIRSPIARDRLVLEQCREEKRNDPGYKNTDGIVADQLESPCRED